MDDAVDDGGVEGVEGAADEREDGVDALVVVVLVEGPLDKEVRVAGPEEGCEGSFDDVERFEDQEEDRKGGGLPSFWDIAPDQK